MTVPARGAHPDWLGARPLRSQVSAPQRGPSPRCGGTTSSRRSLFAGPAPDAPTAAPRPQAAAWAPGNKPPPSREPLWSASGPEATSIPNAATAAGPQVPAGRAAPTCARLEAPAPDVDQLLREMRLLRGLLSRVLELQGARASAGHRATPQFPAPHSAGTPGTPGTPETSPARS